VDDATGRLGLGLAALGRPAYITSGRDGDIGADRSVDALRARTHGMLDAAVARGVRYLDAARSYGLAEHFLGQWLAKRPAATGLVVASKWGYTYVGDWRMDATVHEVKDHGLEAFERQRRETTALLGDRLSMYSVHSVTPQSPVLDDRELLTELVTWAAQVGVRIGLTTSGPQQAEVVERALRTSVGGRPVFSAVQATWNVLEPSAGPALQRAHEAGWLVVVKEGVANGRLAGVEAPSALRAAADSLRVTPDALALAMALAQPWSPTVLSGAVTLSQLDSQSRRCGGRSCCCERGCQRSSSTSRGAGRLLGRALRATLGLTSR
jgi:aryl-alcohol dehydrogenase-like predicted oxidoreductase